ncbi:YdcF family protein [Octadecabacter sp. G9-8]|uniref:YdcF family protein n=1 Tax=Octadecabacter dasysiphoniae TaxID=2909341 RepID=A0ABS9CU19_9RHOB|nr:YdcF family protein [Octadecabacter dasysiphoniae]MCF2870732.1 YdcF family protein [Octadecabacter dasysiphoniae]
MTIALLAWTFLWADNDVRNVQQADVIVCLGAGMDASGTLGPASLRRVEKCVELFDAGVAPVVVFTGGIARPNGPSSANQMAQYGQSLGLPADAVIEEGLAQSTLQNALFSLPMIAQADQLVLVTEAFHLPRSWASFRWAALELGVAAPKMTMVMSEHVRPNDDGRGINWPVLARESIAIWFNAGRATAFSVVPFATADWLH